MGETKKKKNKKRVGGLDGEEGVGKLEGVKPSSFLTECVACVVMLGVCVSNYFYNK